MSAAIWKKCRAGRHLRRQAASLPASIKLVIRTVLAFYCGGIRC